ncbi:ankyrin repeat domain-containing protein 34A-like [Homarus americanus]|uniref:ankyrin repeat domain-containing protein 34A-like n=1 Tax=Homarus americanus TaxID=6706 RepID=UPI001C43CD09|nr:ankyrin repeat domain-containing protein 34A-like [Homarus americanus]
MGGREWAGGVGGLLEAVRKGHPRHVQLLLEAGVPVDGSDDSGSTALVTAVLHSKDERLQERLLRLLLQAGADPNVGDERGTTPLMHAAITNDNKATITLLQHVSVTGRD